MIVRVALIVVVVAAGATVLSLVVGGGVRRDSGLADGAVAVAWALPGLRLVAEVAAVLTVGSLLGALVYSPRGDDGALSVAAWRHSRVAAVAALVWTVAATLQVLFVTADLTGRAVTGLSARLVVNTALYVPQGRAQLIAAVAGLVVFGCAWLAVRPWLLLLALATAAAGIVPAAFAGHAASSLDHATATTSLAAHILFATIWVGGLAALVLHARWCPDGLEVAARRFSAIAVFCFAAVAISGLINAWLRVGSIANLAGQGYGSLLQAKLLALAVLGGIGWWHRQSTLPKLADNRSAFIKLAVVEVVIMAATIGVAVGLSRAQPPGALSVSDLTPADALLGYRMPDAPTPASFLLDWRPDLLFTTACMVGAWLYLAAVLRLRRNGTPWPAHRTLSWLAGVLVVLVATGSGLARYAPVLFSAHMVVHMLLAMLAPILLVLGAPITLALRALPATTDRRYPGARAWIVAALHSRPVRLLTNPVIAAVLWVGGLYVMYFSDAYEYALRNHPAHLALYLHFLLSGYLFFAVLISPDPLPRRVPHMARLVVLMASL
ncbi:copper resistance protein CopD, partial [Actinoplanes sp. ATCC 53533]